MNTSERKFNWFVSQIDILNENGFKNMEIATKLNITATHLSRIIHKTKKVPDDLLDRLSSEFDLNMENFNIDDSQGITSGGIEIQNSYRMREIGNLGLSKDDEIEKLKGDHRKEINNLNSIIDHLRFIIDEYKRLEKK
jgi:hypothetical protein